MISSTPCSPDGLWFTDDDVQSSYGANEIIFCGYRFDPESQLYYVRNRTYNRVLGRWIQRDPIGYDGGIGLFEYASSNPAESLDPIGLKVIVVAFDGLFGYHGGHPGHKANRIFNGGSSLYLKWFVHQFAQGKKYEIKYYPEYSIGRAISEVTPLLTKPIKGAKGPECYNTVLVVGFSNGGAAALRFAGRLAQKGIKANAGFTIDPTAQGPPSPLLSQQFFKLRTTAVWKNYYQRGDNDFFGLLKGNPVKVARNTQLFASDFSPLINWYKQNSMHHTVHSADWFYTGAHKNGWILDLPVVQGAFVRLLHSLPVARRSYK